jgi:hypothetical protein
LTRTRVIAHWMCVPLTALTIFAQEKTQPANSHPAPHITGRLIGMEGDRKLILEYKRDSGRGTFFGTIQSACKIPTKSSQAAETPVDLSNIPKGTQITLFYVRHETKGVGTFSRENVVLGFRIEHLNGDSTLPQGEMISCFKGNIPKSPK